MTAAPPDDPKPNDDMGLDDLLADIDSASAHPGDPGAASVDMDFEKELEDLFADDPAPKPAQASAGQQASDPLDDLLSGPDSAVDEDALLLEDVVEESGDDDVDLVLGAAEEIEFDLPGDEGGAKGGDIDRAGLDDLIDDLGEPSRTKAAPPPAASSATDLDDDLDALLGESSPEPTPTAVPADDELDALLSGMDQGAPEPAQAATDHDDLDALFGDLGESAAPASGPESEPVPDLEDLLSSVEDEPSPAVSSGAFVPETPAVADDMADLLAGLDEPLAPAPAEPEIFADPDQGSDEDMSSLLSGLDNLGQPGPGAGELTLDDPFQAETPQSGEDNLDALIAGLDDPGLDVGLDMGLDQPADSAAEPDVDTLLAEMDGAAAVAAEPELPDLSSPDNELDALLAAMEDPAASPGESSAEALTPEEAGLFVAPPTEDDEFAQLLAEQGLDPDNISASVLDLPELLPAAHDMDMDALLAQGDGPGGASLDQTPLSTNQADRAAHLEETLRAKDSAIQALELRLAALESAPLTGAPGPLENALREALRPDSPFAQELRRGVLEEVAARLESLVPAAAARIIREEIAVLAEELE